MSTYDSAATNANPNDTQVPARHDDLPAPAGYLNQPFQSVDATQHQTRSGGADYPYTTGGDRPQPASENPRWNAPTSVTSNTEERPGVLDYKSGADTYGAAGTGNASSGNGPAERLRGGSQGFGDSDRNRDLGNVTGIDTEPVHRLHSQNDPLPRPSGQDSSLGYGATSSDEPPVHRLHSQSEALPRPSGGFDSNDKYGDDSADTNKKMHLPGAWTDDDSSDARDDGGESAMQAVGNTLSSAVTTTGSMAANYLPDSVVGKLANYAPGIVPQPAKGLDEDKNSDSPAPDVNKSDDRSLDTLSDSKSVDKSSGPSRDTSLPFARSAGGSTESETGYKSIGENHPSVTTGEAGLGAVNAVLPASGTGTSGSMSFSDAGNKPPSDKEHNAPSSTISMKSGHIGSGLTHSAQRDTSFGIGSERDAGSYGTDSNRDTLYGSGNKLGTSFGADSQRDTSYGSGNKPDTSHSADSNQATSHGSDVKHNTSYGSSNKLDTLFGADSQRDTSYRSDTKPDTSYSADSNCATTHGSDIKHDTSYGSSNKLDTSSFGTDSQRDTYGPDTKRDDTYGSESKRDTSYGSGNKLGTSFGTDSQRDTSYGSDSKRDTYGSDSKRDDAFGSDTKRDTSYGADSNRDGSYGSDSKRATSLGTDRQSDYTYGTDNKRDNAFSTDSKRDTSYGTYNQSNTYGTDNKSTTYGTDNKREGLATDAGDYQSTEHAGRDSHPTGHASMTDKLVGKTQQVVGKMTKNTVMQEKGELRQTAGKEAVRENYSAQS